MATSTDGLRTLQDAREAAARGELFGCEVPRLWTRPLRPLTPETSLGFAVIAFADELGVELLPWQRWTLIHALELRPDGRLRFRTVLILVARQNGKTLLKMIVSLWRMYRWNARLVIGTAQDLAQAREVLRNTVEMVTTHPTLAELFQHERKVMGNEHFLLRNGARYLIKAMNRGAGRGLTVDELNIDELREQRDWAGWSSMSTTTSIPKDAQSWLMSNAGDNESVVLNHLRAVALAGSDESMFIAEYSGEDDCALYDVEAIQQANPALGYTLELETVLSSMIMDPPEVYRTERLCQHVTSMHSALDVPAWREMADPTMTLDPVRDRVVLCLEAAEDLANITLVAAGMDSTGRVLVETAAAWQSSRDMRAELPDIVERVKPIKFGWFPNGPSVGLKANLTAVAEPIQGEDVPSACQGLADWIESRLVLHNGDALLDGEVDTAGKVFTGQRWTFASRGPIYALAGAVHLARTVPVPKPRGRLVISPTK